jgi:hypothetical protein
MAGQQDQIETVFDFVDTIFYGDTGHWLVTPSVVELVPEIRLLGIPWRMEIQAFLSWFGLIHLLLDDCKTAGRLMARDFVGSARLRRWQPN